MFADISVADVPPSIVVVVAAHCVVAAIALHVFVVAAPPARDAISAFVDIAVVVAVHFVSAPAAAVVDADANVVVVAIVDPSFVAAVVALFVVVDAAPELYKMAFSVPFSTVGDGLWEKGTGKWGLEGF